MMMRIHVVGTGRLGGYLAYSGLRDGLVSELFLSGRTPERTEAVAHDLEEAYPAARIVPLTGYSAKEPVDVTFFTFSTLRWSSQIDVNDRLIEAKENLRIVDQIATEVEPADLGLLVVVSNPVDLLTSYCANHFGAERVVGFGISVDEVRAARVVSERLGRRIERLPCLGEHGARVVPLLSSLGRQASSLCGTHEEIRERMFAHTREIISKLAIPLYGPMHELDRLLRILASPNATAMSLSVHLERPVLGQVEVALGVGVLLAERSVVGVVVPEDIDEKEAELFTAAASYCREMYIRATTAQQKA